MRTDGFTEYIPKGEPMREGRPLPPLALSPLTPPRAGGIGVLAVWGEGAGTFMRRLFPGIKPGELRYGRLKEEGEVIDEVLAILVPSCQAPSCAEEGEISFHGGRMAQAAVLRHLERRGAAVLTPERYLEQWSCYDTIQKEALLAMGRATTRRQVAFLLGNVHGELSRAVHGVESEGDGAARRSLLAGLLSRASAGMALTWGSRVLVTGPPNAGKSTLVNRLCGTERSIVTDTPGTTRDILEASSEIDGFPIIYLDSGGLTERGAPLYRLASSRTLAAIAEADIVLCLGVDPEALSVRPKAALSLGPKADLGADFGPGVLPVSGLTGIGAEALKAKILELLGAGSEGEGPAPFTGRQIGLLAKAQAAFERGESWGGLAALRLILEGSSTEPGPPEEEPLP